MSEEDSDMLVQGLCKRLGYSGLQEAQGDLTEYLKSPAVTSEVLSDMLFGGDPVLRLLSLEMIGGCIWCLQAPSFVDDDEAWGKVEINEAAELDRLFVIERSLPWVLSNVPHTHPHIAEEACRVLRVLEDRNGGRHFLKHLSEFAKKCHAKGISEMTTNRYSMFGGRVPIMTSPYGQGWILVLERLLWSLVMGCVGHEMSWETDPDRPKIPFNTDYLELREFYLEEVGHDSQEFTLKFD